MTNLPTTTERLPQMSRESETFALRQRQARMFALSPLVPEHLRKGSNEQALANCYIALTMAEAMGESPLIVMQNIHVVSGKAGFSAQYMIARANASGIFKGRIDWRITGKGNDLSVTAFAFLADTGQEVAVTCDMAMAIAEGWTKNSKYKSMPEVMLRYRSATFLVRFYAPDVMLGYQTAEEVTDASYSSSGPDLTAIPLTGAMLIEQATDIQGDEAEEVNEGEIVTESADEVISDDAPPYTPLVTRLLGGIAAAKNAGYLNALEGEFLTHRAGLPDDAADSIEAALSAKRDALAA